MSKLAKRPGLFWGCHAIGILTSVSQTAGFRFLEVLAACWPFQFLDPSHLCWWLRKVKNSQCVDINNITIIVIIIVIIIITCTVYRLSRSQKMPQYMHIYIYMHIYMYIYLSRNYSQRSADSCDFKMLKVFLHFWIDEHKSIRTNCPKEFKSSQRQRHVVV